MNNESEFLYFRLALAIWTREYFTLRQPTLENNYRARRSANKKLEFSCNKSRYCLYSWRFSLGQRIRMD